MLWCQYGLTSAVRSGPKEVTTSLVTPTEAQRQVQFQLLVWHMHCSHDDWCFEADSTYQCNAEQQNFGVYGCYFGMTAARSKLAGPHTVKDAFGTETGVHNEDAA